MMAWVYLFVVFTLLNVVQTQKIPRRCKSGSKNCAPLERRYAKAYIAPLHVYLLYTYKTNDIDCIQDVLEQMLEVKLFAINSIFGSNGFDVKVRKPSFGNVPAVTTFRSGQNVVANMGYEIISEKLPMRTVLKLVERLPIYTKLPGWKFDVPCGDLLAVQFSALEFTCDYGDQLNSANEQIYCVEIT